MIRRKRNSKGQAIVEYIIVIVVVAIAALTVMGLFSDRLRTLIAGIAGSLGDNSAAAEATGKKSTEILKEMTADGVNTSN